MKFFAVIVSLLMVYFSKGNTNLFQKVTYSLMYLPAKFGVDKIEVNKKLALAKNEKEVVNILRSYPKLSKGSFIIRTVINGNYSWWRINFDNGVDKKGDWIVMQSKYSELVTISKYRELKSFYQDTVAIIDSLRQSIVMQDISLGLGDFYFDYQCQGIGKIFTTTKLTNSRGDLVWRKTLFDSCLNSNYFFVKLKNRTAVQPILATCNIRFLDMDEKTEIIALYKSLKEESPALSNADAVQYLVEYIHQNFGKVSFATLNSWLQTAVR